MLARQPVLRLVRRAGVNRPGSGREEEGFSATLPETQPMRAFYNKTMRFSGARADALNLVRDEWTPTFAAFRYKIKEVRSDGVVVSRRQLPENVRIVASLLIVLGLLAGFSTGGNALAVVAFWVGVILAAVIRENVETSVVVEDCAPPAGDAVNIRVTGYPEKRFREFFDNAAGPRLWVCPKFS